MTAGPRGEGFSPSSPPPSASTVHHPGGGAGLIPSPRRCLSNCLLAMVHTSRRCRSEPPYGRLAYRQASGGRAGGAQGPVARPAVTGLQTRPGSAGKPMPIGSPAPASARQNGADVSRSALARARLASGWLTVRGCARGCPESARPRWRPARRVGHRLFVQFLCGQRVDAPQVRGARPGGGQLLALDRRCGLAGQRRRTPGAAARPGRQASAAGARPVSGRC